LAALLAGVGAWWLMAENQLGWLSAGMQMHVLSVRAEHPNLLGQVLGSLGGRRACALGSHGGRRVCVCAWLPWWQACVCAWQPWRQACVRVRLAALVAGVGAWWLMAEHQLGWLSAGMQMHVLSVRAEHPNLLGQVLGSLGGRRACALGSLGGRRVCVCAWPPWWQACVCAWQPWWQACVRVRLAALVAGVGAWWLQELGWLVPGCACTS